MYIVCYKKFVSGKRPEDTGKGERKFILREQTREDVGWVEWSSGHLGTL
jgi:hypothetical protein